MGPMHLSGLFQILFIAVESFGIMFNSVCGKQGLQSSAWFAEPVPGDNQCTVCPDFVLTLSKAQRSQQYMQSGDSRLQE